MTAFDDELAKHSEPIRRVARFFRHPDGPLEEAFQAFAHFLLTELPDSAEVNVTLRKLLETRDAAHRAVLGPDPSERHVLADPPRRNT